MTKIVTSLLSLCALFASCVQSPRTIDSQLMAIDSLVETRSDSALVLLEAIDDIEKFDSYNKAYYSILLTAARNKEGISLIESDPLIDSAIKSLNKEGDEDLLARAYLYKGRIWLELEDSEQAIHAFQKGIDLLLKQEDYNTETLAKIYDDLGNLYIQEGLYDLALRTFKEEYCIDVAKEDLRGLVFSLRNIGNTFYYFNELDSVYYYLQKAMDYALQTSDSLYLLDGLYNDYAIYYEMQGEYDRALEYLNQISHIDENNRYNKAKILIGKGDIDSSIHILQELLSSEDLEMRLISYLSLSEFDYKKGNYKDAYNYSRFYTLLLDSILLQKKTKEIQIINYKYDIEREKTKIKSDLNQFLIIAGFILLVFLLILFFVHLLRKKRRELREKERDNELLRIEQELLHKETEFTRLNEEFISLQSALAILQKQRNENISLYQEEIRKKKEEIEGLKQEIEKKKIMLTPVFRRLQDIERQIKEKKISRIKADVFKEIYNELERSFPELIAKIREESPYMDKENILMLCLYKFEFTSRTTSFFLNISDNTVRQRIARLKPKLPRFFEEI